MPMPKPTGDLIAPINRDNPSRAQKAPKIRRAVIMKGLRREDGEKIVSFGKECKLHRAKRDGLAGIDENVVMSDQLS